MSQIWWMEYMKGGAALVLAVLAACAIVWVCTLLRVRDCAVCRYADSSHTVWKVLWILILHRVPFFREWYKLEKRKPERLPPVVPRGEAAPRELRDGMRSRRRK